MQLIARKIVNLALWEEDLSLKQSVFIPVKNKDFNIYSFIKNNQDYEWLKKHNESAENSFNEYRVN